MYNYLKDIKKGEYFTRGAKYIEYPSERQVWVKGEYDRSLKAYECHRWDDVNHVGYISGKTIVYTGFTF